MSRADDALRLLDEQRASTEAIARDLGARLGEATGLLQRALDGYYESMRIDYRLVSEIQDFVNGRNQEAPR